MNYKGLTAGRGVGESLGEEGICGGPRYRIWLSGGQIFLAHRNADVACPVNRSFYSANLVKPLQSLLSASKGDMVSNMSMWFPAGNQEDNV
jgi:hypothetical protein